MSKQDIYLQRTAQVQRTKDEINKLEKERENISSSSNAILEINHELYELSKIQFDLKGEELERHIDKIKSYEERREEIRKKITASKTDELAEAQKHLFNEIDHCYAAIAEDEDEGFVDDIIELASVLKCKTKKEYVGKLTFVKSSKWIVKFKPSGFLNKYLAEPAVFIISSYSPSSIDGKYIYQWNYFAKESDIHNIGITNGSDYMAGSEVIKNLLDFWDFKVHINS